MQDRQQADAGGFGPQDPIDAMVQEFQTRRDCVVDGLNSLDGVSCIKPHGAFYAFANIVEATRARGQTAKEFQSALLEEAGVAALAGTAFGTSAEGYLRLSYANSIENIQEAVSRMAQFLAR